MALSDFAVRQAKPAVAAYSLADGDGLALYVPSSEGKIVAFSLLLAGKAETHIFWHLSRGQFSRSVRPCGTKLGRYWPGALIPS